MRIGFLTLLQSSISMNNRADGLIVISINGTKHKSYLISLLIFLVFSSFPLIEQWQWSQISLLTSSLLSKFWHLLESQRKFYICGGEKKKEEKSQKEALEKKLKIVK